MAIRAKVKLFFSAGHERTLKAKKNVAISFFLKGCSILISFLLISLTINYVNPTQYGIWLTLSSVISWLNYFDIGLGNGLKNKLAQTNALGKHHESKTYVSTTYALLFIISAIIFSVFYVVNLYLNWNNILNTPADTAAELSNAALLLIGMFCIQFVIQIINTVLTANHAVSKVSLLVLVGQVLCLIVIYVLKTHTTGSLTLLILVIAGIPILVQFVASFWYYSNDYKSFAPNFHSINLKYSKYLLTTGGSFFFIQIGSLILLQTDNIIITQLNQPKDVAVFNIAFKLFAVITMIFTIIIAPFWSAFTDAYTKGDMEWIKKMISKMRKIWLFLCAGSIALFLLSPLIYKLWLHKSITVPVSLSFAMCFYVMGYTWIMLHCYLVNAINKIRLQVYMYLVSIFVNVPMAIYFGKLFGLAGVTFSNFLIFVIMGIFLAIQTKKILEGNNEGIWNK